MNTKVDFKNNELDPIKIQCVDKFHIRHLMPFEFQKHEKIVVVIKTINIVYPDILDVRKWQRWFKNFKDRLDGIKGGRIVKFDEDLLLAKIPNKQNF